MVVGKSLLSPAPGDVPPIKPQLPPPNIAAPKTSKKSEKSCRIGCMRRGGIIPSLSLRTLESFLAKQGIEKFAKILSRALAEKLQRNEKTPYCIKSWGSNCPNPIRLAVCSHKCQCNPPFTQNKLTSLEDAIAISKI